MSRCLNALMLPVIPALILTAAGLARAESTPETVEFNRDIRPILAENCFQCHGPDENKREADLRLDTPENVFQDRDGYSVIVPGDLQSSELFLRMTAKDESKRMPPADAERTVTDRELLLIRRWIERGAR